MKKIEKKEEEHALSPRVCFVLIFIRNILSTSKIKMTLSLWVMYDPS